MISTRILSLCCIYGTGIRRGMRRGYHNENMLICLVIYKNNNLRSFIQEKD